MKLADMATSEIIEAIRAGMRVLGPEAYSVRVFMRELDRRLRRSSNKTRMPGAARGESDER